MTDSPLQSALRECVEKYWPEGSPYFEQMGIDDEWWFKTEPAWKHAEPGSDWIILYCAAHEIGIIAAVASSHWRARAKELEDDLIVREGVPTHDECQAASHARRAANAWFDLFELSQQAREAGNE